MKINCETNNSLFSDILNEENESAVSAAAPVDDALIRMEHVDDMPVVRDDGRCIYLLI